MRAARTPFNEADANDRLADLARREIAEAGIRILMSNEHHVATRPESVEFMLLGVLTGVCGVAISQFNPAAGDAAHADLRAWLCAAIPQAFDQARDILDLPPLPELH